LLESFCLLWRLFAGTFLHASDFIIHFDLSLD
jgi:hypothetical protein